jgi:hypothetical protein
MRGSDSPQPKRQIRPRDDQAQLGLDFRLSGELGIQPFRRLVEHVAQQSCIAAFSHLGLHAS